MIFMDKRTIKKKCDNTHNKSKDDNSKALKNIIKKDSQAYIGVKMS